MYVWDDLDKVYDSCIVDFWKDYRNIDKTHISFNVSDVEENIRPELSSPQPSAGPI